MARVELCDVVITEEGAPSRGTPVAITAIVGGSANLWEDSSGEGVYSSVVTDASGVFRVWLDEGEYQVAPATAESKRVALVSPATIAALLTGEGTLTMELATLATAVAAIGSSTVGAAPGDLRFTALPELEAGWLVCDGSSVLRATYLALFEAIGTAYGAADGTHFNLPDYRERVAMGLGGVLARGAKGGEATHVLTTAEMPAHKHKTEGAEGAGWFNANIAAGAIGVLRKFISPSVETGETGGGTAHNNLQPYTVCSVWIKS